jgi:hypothetical protein
VHLQFAPTHTSERNQVGLLLSILQRRLLRPGEFNSVDDLADRIIAFSRTLEFEGGVTALVDNIAIVEALVPRHRRSQPTIHSAVTDRH